MVRKTQDFLIDKTFKFYFFVAAFFLQKKKTQIHTQAGHFA